MLSHQGTIKLCDFGSATTVSHAPDYSWSAQRRALVEEEVRALSIARAVGASHWVGVSASHGCRARRLVQGTRVHTWVTGLQLGDFLCGGSAATCGRRALCPPPSRLSTLYAPGRGVVLALVSPGRGSRPGLLLKQTVPGEPWVGLPVSLGSQHAPCSPVSGRGWCVCVFVCCAWARWPPPCSVSSLCHRAHPVYLGLGFLT